MADKCREKVSENVKNSERVLLQYQKKVEKHCNELRAIADEIDHWHKGTVIANITGSSIGIAGGALSIVGLIASPFTFGASLALTGVGVGVGVLAGATNIGATVTDSVQQKNKLERATKIIEEYQKESEAMALHLQSACHEIRSCIETNEKDLVNGAFAGTSAALSKSLSVVSTVTEAVTKSGMKTFKAVSGVLSALFIAWDIYAVAADAKELTQGSETKIAAEIRKAADNIEQELGEYEKHLRELKSIQFC